MSYFEDQWDAWMHNDQYGNVEDYDTSELAIEKDKQYTTYEDMEIMLDCE
jgi:hypothetical protein